MPAAHSDYRVPYRPLLVEMIHPALNGTLSILRSIYAHAPTVKRVVLTASVVSIWELGLPQPKEFDETMWNEQAIELCKTKGSEAGPAMFYGASKTLAEKGKCISIGLCTTFGLTEYNSRLGVQRSEWL